MKIGVLISRKIQSYHSHYDNQNDYISRNGVKGFCSYGT